MILLNNNFNICFLAVYSELYLIFATLFSLCFFVIIDNILNKKISLIKNSGYISIYILFLTSILNNNLKLSDFNIFFESLKINEVIIILKNFLIVIVICIIFISFSYLKHENIYIYEFYILLNFVLLGLFIIISSNDLLIMYIGIELLSLSFYLLTSLKIYSNFSTEAGLKYFILGAFSSGLLLYGSSLIYGSLGSINFSDIDLILIDFDVNFFELESLLIGFIFIIVAILFKLGAAPFHMWLPDVYEGSPTIVTLIFSILPKISIFFLFYNLNLIFFNLNIYFFKDLLFYVSLLSIIIGSLGALYQTKIKRLLAYSAINHIGFLLISFLTFTYSSIFSLFFYFFVYILISINIFVVILVLRKYNNNLKLKKINEFVLIFKSYPLLAINLALILFSVAGIPPLVGFYSKLYIFVSALNSELYLLVLIAALFSVISCMYYIRLIKLMFFKKFEYWALFIKINKFESYILSIIFVFNLFFFFYPDLIILKLYFLSYIINC